jgi:hypothetical protein
LWLCEGELKSDFCSERLGAVIVSIPGVDLWARALPDLQTLLPLPGRVVVAMDADWRKKPTVLRAMWHLAIAAQALGYEVEVALWDETNKGLDDLLKNGKWPERQPTSAIPTPPWKPKTSSIPLADGLAMKIQAETLEDGR